MSDRTAIFGAIASANRVAGASSEEIANEALSLVAVPKAVQPDFAGLSLLDRFIAKATSERVTATVDQVQALADVPNAVARYLKNTDQYQPVVVQYHTDLGLLDWSEVDRIDTLSKDGGTAVTYAEYGIAETGSVVFRSGANSPILMNFLPLTHIVVLRAATILGYPEDLWPFLGGPDAPQSRLLTIVTGTSGTADIEARNVRGAHGPRHMHIIVARDP